MRNIYFPFDIEEDTALCVAKEMISELDMPDTDVTKIAEMIDGEIAYLVRTWKPGLPKTDDISNSQTPSTCCCTSSAASIGSLAEHVSSSGNFQSNPIPKVESFIMHGRFEERTYQTESDDSPTEGTSGISIELTGKNSNVMHAPPRSPGWSSQEAIEDPSYQELEIPNELNENKHFQSDVPDDVNKPYSDIHRLQETMTKFSYITPSSSPRNMSGDYGKEIIHVLRQLKAKCQIKLRRKQIEETAKEFTTMPFQENHKTKSGINTPSSALSGGKQGFTFRSFSLRRKIQNLQRRNKTFFISKKPVSNYHQGRYSNLGKQKAEDVEPFTQYTPESMLSGNKIYNGMLFPHSIRREKSLPFDPFNIKD